jgi:GTPase Era involved in 16S rRNA processing
MVAEQYLQLRSEVETALASLLKLGTELRRPSETLDTIHGILSDLREPLLFVVVGEVKSGKSSLLNALFGQEFAKVDVLPATDKVCIFRYATEEKQVDVSPKLIERYLPIPFLRDFNVVDTPGTNTIVAEHQTITENFVPRADLILFVFSVVNPWTQSAWEFLNFIQKRWLKNVVFVLQQADLREPAEIEVIHRHLQENAVQKLGFAPPIFAVSARKALLARTTGVDKERLWKESEFQALQNQIDRVVRESETRLLKLRSAIRTARVVIDELAAEIQGAIDVIGRDEARINRIEHFIEARKAQSSKQTSALAVGVEKACRDCSNEGEKLLHERLSFWKTWQIIFGRARWQRDFQMQMEMKLRQTIEPQVEQAVQILETDLRGLWPQLNDMLQTLLEKDLRSHVPRIIPDFARQRRELLQSVHITLAERVAGKTVAEELAHLFEETSTRLRVPAGVAAAGGVVALIAAMSSAAVADVTGILAASAAITGTFVALSQRKKILKAYEAQMTGKCRDLVKAIEQQLAGAIDVFYAEVASAFHPLQAFCTAKRKQFEPSLQRTEELKRTFEALNARIG